MKALREAAARRGFKRWGRSGFLKEHPETTGLVELQRSSWGPQFYVNVGVWIKGSRIDERPCVHRAHLTWRVTVMMDAGNAASFEEALDLSKPVPNRRRHELIRDGTDICGFSILEECTMREEAMALAAAWPNAIAVNACAFSRLAESLT